ncbi:MAG: calcium/sodium antiporter [Nitriliruptoraceae bacterium]|nr:calcium/sodium antiporter [Nitriliruptoraceae bacterium]
MLLASVGLVVGLALLTVAADQFVAGSARLATVWRISPIVVGAVIIGIGTSAPELLVSGLAAAQGSVDLAVGNVVGSNVANLSLVLGIAALITPIVVRSPVLKREAPLSLGVTALFALLVQRGIGTAEGIVLLVALAVALVLIIVAARNHSDDAIAGEVEEFLHGRLPSVRREVGRTVLGLVVTLVGAQLLVTSATTIAREIGLAEGFVGLTIVAIGTSLPELATAIAAARKAETDLLVGNLLGSNLFNSGAVAAAVAIAGPRTVVDPTISVLGVGLMLLVALVATAFMITGRRVVRVEGALLLLAYLAALPFLAG